MRDELRKKYFLDWGQAFSRKDELTHKPAVELVTVSRKSVAKAGDVEFIAPTKRRSRSKKKKANKIKFSWDLAIGALLLAIAINLFFTSGGIVDLIQAKTQIQDGEKYLSQVKTENVELKKEIYNLNNSSKYQKKIAREHLGAIARDEYLVIFGD